MISVFITILPVFLILATGYFARRIDYLPDTIADALNIYALKLAVPVLLFMAMYRLDFSTAFNVKMLVGYYAGALSCFVIGITMSRILFKRRPGESVSVGFSATFSNTVLIGIPIAQLAFGDPIMAPLFGIIAFHASSLYTVGIFTMEFTRRDGRPISETARSAVISVAANPLFCGIVLGVITNLIGLELPKPVEGALDMIVATAIPASLVGIGIALNRYKIKSELAESMIVCALALIVHPAIVLLLTHYVFELPIVFVQAAVLLAAMPSGMNIYIFAKLYERAVGLSASVIVISNALSVFTITAWLLMLRGMS